MSINPKLTPEKMDLLMKRLGSIVEIGKSKEAEGLLSAEISTRMVRAMTKVKGIEDVIERDEQLSKTYQGFLNMYGFDSMYDMYLYAQSCDPLGDPYHEEISKRKDYSKLVPVKRKITRNGKETEVTIYEDPNKGGSESNEGNSAGRGTSSGGGASHARELKGKVHGDKEKANPKKLAKLKQVAQGMQGSPGGFKDSDYFLELRDEGGEVAGIIGYSEEGEYLVMDFYKTNKQVPGIAARGFSELVNLALDKDKGVKVEDNPQARPVFIKFGLERDETTGAWAITSDDLKESMGKSGNDRD